MSKCNRSHLNPNPLEDTGKRETAKGTTSPGSDHETLDNNPEMGH